MGVENGKNGKDADQIEKVRARRQKKKARAKQRKKDLAEQERLIRERRAQGGGAASGIEIDYVSQQMDSNDWGTLLFHKVFDKFSKAEELPDNAEQARAQDAQFPTQEDAEEDSSILRQPEEDIDGEEVGEEKLSNRKRKEQKRLKISELKQLVDRPDIVNEHDCNAADPRLLIFMKSCRNSVKVPMHWCQKRKYLQGKRGFEKPPFALPKFLQDTGITAMREQQLEIMESKSLKQKAREQVKPKRGKIAINYQLLHDAFFRHQTKPDLTTFGELYHEGKEFEVKFKKFKPGIVSQKLKDALKMNDNSPPPWLINMQRFGPPPAYPDLKIPGLNSPIPPGQSYGYAEGQWGKPPVDRGGVPLYGNPFAVWTGPPVIHYVNRSIHWGKMLPEEESEDESSSSDEEEEPEETPDGTQTDATLQSGIETGTSVGSGMTTPDQINLRKQRPGDTPSSVSTGLTTPSAFDTPGMTPHGLATPDLRKPGATPDLYKVLERKQNRVSGKFGSSYTYDTKGRKVADGGVDIALDPAELEGLDEEQLKQKYRNATRRRDDDDDASERPAKRRKSRFGRKRDEEYDVKF